MSIRSALGLAFRRQKGRWYWGLCWPINVSSGASVGSGNRAQPGHPKSHDYALAKDTSVCKGFSETPPLWRPNSTPLLGRPKQHPSPPSGPRLS